MRQSSYGIGVVLLCCVGCTAQQPWRPTVDTFGSSQAQYVNRDMEECRMLALQSSGQAPQAGVRGAVAGGLLGAATGAAIGAAFGSAGRGAAVGAAAGGIGGGLQQANQTEQAFQRAFSTCMRQRGHNVL